MNNRIKELRTKHLKEKGIDLTQKEFGEKIGISENYVWMIEKGSRTPSDRTIGDICKEFDCNEVWLRTGAGAPFQEITKEEEIMRLAVKIVKGSDSFRKSLVSMIANMDSDDLAGLEKFLDGLLEQYKKD